MKLTVEHKKYIKATCGIGLAVSTLGWIGYESYRTYRILTNLVNTNVLDYQRKTPQYIYIKHQTYREEMLKSLREKEKYVIIEKIFQPFSKWWKTIKHSLAFRLLKMAQEGDQHQRVKAIYQLAQIKHLKDWDFRHLAQICDPRTAAALANSDCDERWFLSPRQYGVHKSIKEILGAIKGIMEQLTPNKCIDYIMENTFGHQDVKEPEGFHGMPVSEMISKQDHDQLLQCLEALLHITTDAETCKKIVADRGLETLIEIEKLDHTNSDIRIPLCRIVANLTGFANDSYDYFVTGWIGILSKWSHDIDIRLQVTASLALGNLDHDDPNHCIFGPKVYQLYPSKRQKVAPKLDIVFVHGLLGGVFITWRQKDRIEKEVSLSSKKELVIPGQSAKDKVGKRKSSAKSPKKTAAPVAPQSLSEEETLIGSGADKVENMTKLQEKPKIKISDPETSEVFKALHQDDLGSDWCVVYPDIPIAANAAASIDEMSVSGDHWQHEDHDDYTFCWPMEWLPEDFPHIRVIGLNYESSLSEWTAISGCPCEKEKGKLQPRAFEFLRRLAAADVGKDRPVVWVGHSMGGLLIKSIMVQGLQQSAVEFQALAKNSQAVLFLGTPHRGSTIAKLKQHTSAIFWPSVEVQDLEANAKWLLDLHEAFLKFLTKTKYPMEIVSITEGRPTILTSWKFPLSIVNEESSHISHGDLYMSKDDHLGISKPMCRHSFFYQRLVRMLHNALLHPEKERAEDADVDFEKQIREMCRKLFDMS